MIDLIYPSLWVDRSCRRFVAGNSDGLETETVIEANAPHKLSSGWRICRRTPGCRSSIDGRLVGGLYEGSPHFIAQPIMVALAVE
jgi:hypothetical protein